MTRHQRIRMHPAWQSGDPVPPRTQMRIIRPGDAHLFGIENITGHREIGDGRMIGRHEGTTGEMFIHQFEPRFGPSAQKFGRPRLAGFGKGQQKAQA